MTTEVQRIQLELGQAGLVRRLVKTDGDVAVSSTSFTAIPGASGSINLQKTSRIMILVNAYGRASLLQSLRLTVFIDGANVVGSGGAAMTEGDQGGALCIVAVSNALSAGVHTFELRARVTGGSGTVFADLTSVPLVVSALILESTEPPT